MPEEDVLKLAAANLSLLYEICQRPGRILVLMQNNPDPDAIASAMVVRHLVYERLKKRATLGYGGVLGRAENRAMVRELGVDMTRLRTSDLDRFATLCLVDTQPRTGNNAMFTSRPADIVIDHHIPPRKDLWDATLRDVRPEYGATSTIMFEYLQAAGITPDATLATALYYGIQSDTQELGREAGPADIEAFMAMVPLADKVKLARIRRASVPPEYFGMLREGLNNAVVAGKAVVTCIHDAGNPDIFAEIAELMLRLEGVRSSVCYGRYADLIYLSTRAADARGNCAQRMKRVVHGIGTGGGHLSMAGGQVPLKGDADAMLDEVRGRVLAIFAPGQIPRPLLEKPPCA